MIRSELPRQKQQTVMKKLIPSAYFVETIVGDLIKIELFTNKTRLFIWVNKKSTTVINAKEQLATDLLFNEGLV